MDPNRRGYLGHSHLDPIRRTDQLRNKYIKKETVKNKEDKWTTEELKINETSRTWGRIVTYSFLFNLISL